MRAGLMRDTISVWKSVQTTGKTGAKKSAWKNCLGDGRTVHARVTYGRQQMTDKEGNFVLASTIIFNIRYLEGLTEYMRIYWQERKYRINAIRRYRERGEMQIDAELIDE